MITPRISRRHVQDDVAGIVSRTPGVPTLDVSDLVKRYGDVLALDGCSLQVPARLRARADRDDRSGQVTGRPICGKSQQRRYCRQLAHAPSPRTATTGPPARRRPTSASMSSYPVNTGLRGGRVSPARSPSSAPGRCTTDPGSLVGGLCTFLVCELIDQVGTVELSGAGAGKIRRVPRRQQGMA